MVENSIGRSIGRNHDSEPRLSHSCILVGDAVGGDVGEAVDEAVGGDVGDAVGDAVGDVGDDINVSAIEDPVAEIDRGSDAAQGRCFRVNSRGDRGGGGGGGVVDGVVGVNSKTAVASG